MLTVLGGLAEFERDLIRTRTSEGRARAVARGIRLGRKPELTSHQIKEALRRREAGEALTEIARTYNVSHSTISRLGNPLRGTAMTVSELGTGFTSPSGCKDKESRYELD
jgi:DNA invertase Pin-like site-specific DNA recombinase